MGGFVVIFARLGLSLGEHNDKTENPMRALGQPARLPSVFFIFPVNLSSSQPAWLSRVIISLQNEEDNELGNAPLGRGFFCFLFLFSLFSFSWASP